MNPERELIEQVLETIMDGHKITLDENLLVANVEDARALLHEATVILGQFVSQMPWLVGVSIIADVLHRVACEKTAKGEVSLDQPEEPTSWSSESPFLR
jgi:hypothetical protein